MRPEQLQVVTAISNPVRFRSRWALWEAFQLRMRHAGVGLLTVELTYGDHEAVCRHGYGDHLHVKTDGHNILWHKEDLLNIGAVSLPHAKYLAFVDADTGWTVDDWPKRTLDALQITPVVQMFRNAHDLGPDGTTLSEAHSFVYSYNSGLRPTTPQYDDNKFHPGYAWAMTANAYSDLGGLIDFAIMGSADRHMCMAYFGLADRSMPSGIHPSYRALVTGWQANALVRLHKHIGYVPLTLLHYWHGRKALRSYQNRWRVLVARQFDPTADIVRNRRHYGLIEWSHTNSPRLQALRDDVYRYMTSRAEDSVDLA